MLNLPSNTPLLEEQDSIEAVQKSIIAKSPTNLEKTFDTFNMSDRMNASLGGDMLNEPEKLSFQNEGFLVSDAYTKLSDGTYITRYDDFQQGTDNEDRNARNQSAPSKWINGLTKFGGKTLTNVVGGTLGTAYGAISAIGSGNWENIYDNDFYDFLDDQSTKMDNFIPNYRKQEERDLNFFQSMGTANFWADDFLGGLSFMTGTIISEGLWAAATGGTSLTTAAARAAMRGSKAFRGVKAIGEGAKNLSKGVKEATKIGKQYLRNNALKAPIRDAVITGKFAEVGNALRFTYTSAGFEAGMEARLYQREQKNAFYDDFESLNGRKPSASEIADFENNLDKTTNMLWATNMALVGTSNLAIFGKTFGVTSPFKKSSKALNKYLYGTGTKSTVNEAGERVVEALTRNKVQRTLGFATNILKNPFYEGVVEEGGQATASTAMESYLTSRYNPNKEAMDVVESMYDGFTHTYGTKEGWKEVGLGMLIGLVGGEISNKMSGQRFFDDARNAGQKQDGFVKKEKNEQGEDIVTETRGALGLAYNMNNNTGKQVVDKIFAAKFEEDLGNATELQNAETEYQRAESEGDIVGMANSGASVMLTSIKHASDFDYMEDQIEDFRTSLKLQAKAEEGGKSKLAEAYGIEQSEVESKIEEVVAEYTDLGDKYAEAKEFADYVISDNPKELFEDASDIDVERAKQAVAYQMVMTGVMEKNMEGANKALVEAAGQLNPNLAEKFKLALREHTRLRKSDKKVVQAKNKAETELGLLQKELKSLIIKRSKVNQKISSTPEANKSVANEINVIDNRIAKVEEDIAVKTAEVSEIDLKLAEIEGQLTVDANMKDKVRKVAEQLDAIDPLLGDGSVEATTIAKTIKDLQELDKTLAESKNRPLVAKIRKLAQEYQKGLEMWERNAQTLEDITNPELGLKRVGTMMQKKKQAGTTTLEFLKRLQKTQDEEQAFAQKLKESMAPAETEQTDTDQTTKQVNNQDKANADKGADPKTDPLTKAELQVEIDKVEAKRAEELAKLDDTNNNQSELDQINKDEQDDLNKFDVSSKESSYYNQGLKEIRDDLVKKLFGRERQKAQMRAKQLANSNISLKEISDTLKKEFGISVSGGKGQLDEIIILKIKAKYQAQRDALNNQSELDRIKTLPFKDRISALIKAGIIASPITYNLGNRFPIIVDIAGVKVGFYRSSQGTGGKEKGVWTPMFGFGISKGNPWLIKGDINSQINKNYNSEAIKEYSDILNNTLNWSHEIDKGSVKNHPFFSTLKLAGSKESFNKELYNVEDLGIINNETDVSGYINSKLEEINNSYQSKGIPIENQSNNNNKEQEKINKKYNQQIEKLRADNKQQSTGTALERKIAELKAALKTLVQTNNNLLKNFSDDGASISEKQKPTETDLERYSELRTKYNGDINRIIGRPVETIGKQTKERGQLSDAEIVEYQNLTQKLLDWRIVTGTNAEGISVQEILDQIDAYEQPVKEAVPQLTAEEVAEIVRVSEFQIGRSDKDITQTPGYINMARNGDSLEVSHLSTDLIEEIVGAENLAQLENEVQGKMEYEVFQIRNADKTVTIKRAKDTKRRFVIKSESVEDFYEILGVQPVNYKLKSSWGYIFKDGKLMESDFTLNEFGVESLNIEEIYKLKEGDKVKFSVNPNQDYNMTEIFTLIEQGRIEEAMANMTIYVRTPGGQVISMLKAGKDKVADSNFMLVRQAAYDFLKGKFDNKDSIEAQLEEQTITDIGFETTIKKVFIGTPNIQLDASGNIVNYSIEERHLDQIVGYGYAESGVLEQDDKNIRKAFIPKNKNVPYVIIQQGENGAKIAYPVTLLPTANSLQEQVMEIMRKDQSDAQQSIELVNLLKSNGVEPAQFDLDILKEDNSAELQKMLDVLDKAPRTISKKELKELTKEEFTSMSKININLDNPAFVSPKVKINLSEQLIETETGKQTKSATLTPLEKRSVIENNQGALIEATRNLEKGEIPTKDDLVQLADAVSAIGDQDLMDIYFGKSTKLRGDIQKLAFYNQAIPSILTVKMVEEEILDTVDTEKVGIPSDEKGVLDADIEALKENFTPASLRILAEKLIRIMKNKFEILPSNLVGNANNLYHIKTTMTEQEMFDNDDNATEGYIRLAQNYYKKVNKSYTVEEMQDIIEDKTGMAKKDQPKTKFDLYKMFYQTTSDPRPSKTTNVQMSEAKMLYYREDFKREFLDFIERQETTNENELWKNVLQHFNTNGNITKNDILTRETLDKYEEELGGFYDGLLEYSIINKHIDLQASNNITIFAEDLEAGNRLRAVNNENLPEPTTEVTQLSKADEIRVENEKADFIKYENGIYENMSNDGQGNSLYKRIVKIDSDFQIPMTQIERPFTTTRLEKLTATEETPAQTNKTEGTELNCSE